MSNILIKKAEQLLSQCEDCQVASITADGYPRICILKPLKSMGIKQFWFSTGMSSKKVQQFLNNDKAGATFYYAGNSVTLIGHMKIVSDKAIKDNLWQDFLGKHFSNSGKNDPEYCIIHFVANEATIYIDNEFETINI